MPDEAMPGAFARALNDQRLTWVRKDPPLRPVAGEMLNRAGSVAGGPPDRDQPSLTARGACRRVYNCESSIPLSITKSGTQFEVTALMMTAVSHQL